MEEKYETESDYTDTSVKREGQEYDDNSSMASGFSYLKSGGGSSSSRSNKKAKRLSTNIQKRQFSKQYSVGSSTKIVRMGTEGTKSDFDMASVGDDMASYDDSQSGQNFAAEQE